MLSEVVGVKPLDLRPFQDTQASGTPAPIQLSVDPASSDDAGVTRQRCPRPQRFQRRPAAKRDRCINATPDTEVGAHALLTAADPKRFAGPERERLSSNQLLPLAEQ